MPRAEIWSEEEVRHIIVDYMAMLRQELAGQPYNKTQHRLALRRRLPRRSGPSIEYKHRNVSAALMDLGQLWIPGYLPASNYQQSLRSTVATWLADNPELADLASEAVERRAVPREDIDFEALLSKTRPPGRSTERETKARLGDGPRPFHPIHRDYAAMEAHNRSLGLAGERLIVEAEQHRLRRLGLQHLARRVEHVAQTRGDGCGFDVLSFHPDGREHFIEVKTTGFAPEVPFFASPAEVRFSEAHAPQFSLFRVHSYRREPGLFILPGAIADHCSMDPASFRCRLQGWR